MCKVLGSWTDETNNSGLQLSRDGVICGVNTPGCEDSVLKYDNTRQSLLPILSIAKSIFILFIAIDQ